MGHLTYFAMLVPWGLFVLVIQWAACLAALRSRWRVVVLATLLPTAYLIGADSFALAQGIWTIHDDRIVGLRVGNVPIEECLFFLTTNLIVVQSVILLNAPESRARVTRLVSRLQRRSRSGAASPRGNSS